MPPHGRKKKKISKKGKKFEYKNLLHFFIGVSIVRLKIG